MKRKTRSLGLLPPKIDMYLFNSLIQPILLYGSDVWGTCNNSSKQIDKVYLYYMKNILLTKSNTSSLIVHGECGLLPPSMMSVISMLCYLNRIHHLPDTCLVKQVYTTLCHLDGIGLDTWVTAVNKLKMRYGVNFTHNRLLFKKLCKEAVLTYYTT